LGKEVCHKFVVVAYSLVIEVHWSLRFAETNKLRRKHSSLLHLLVEAVLKVGARLTEYDRASKNTLIKPNTVPGNTLSVAFHIELLDMRWESA
jgi:hypothetical protein